MQYVLPAGGCIFPVASPNLYGLLPGEGKTMRSLELIDKGKNGFGDIVYTLRDESGIHHRIFEREIEAYLKKHGVPALSEGKPYLYPRKK